MVTELEAIYIAIQSDAEKSALPDDVVFALISRLIGKLRAEATNDGNQKQKNNYYRGENE